MAATFKSQAVCGGSSPLADRWRYAPRNVLTVVRDHPVSIHNTEVLMPSFHHGDVEIAYLDEGEAIPSFSCTALHRART